MPHAPAVHPDGDRLAFGCDGGPGQMNLGGTGFDVLYRYEYGLAYPAWSPSGDRLAFVDTELICGLRVIFIRDGGRAGTQARSRSRSKGTTTPSARSSWVEEQARRGPHPRFGGLRG